ncbi:hypothetical protein FACS1894166_09720 [Bacilli bacterium]|nr:hypothetical protein FACS1894166_09720 [Bacilli bacterium]
MNDNVLSRKDPQLGQGIYHVQFTCTGTNMAGDPIVLTDSLTVIISPQNNLALMFSTEDTYQLTGSNRPIYASLASANYDVLPNTNSLVVVVNGVPSSNFSINFTNNGPGITINDIIPITTEQTINIQILDTVNNITSNGITINYVHKVPVADNS